MANSDLPPVLKARFAQTIFCDDLRREDTGKLLVVGMYGAGMFLSELPAAIPFLHMIVSGSTPADDPFKLLKIRVYLGQNVISEMEVNDFGSMAEGAPVADPLPGEPTTRVHRFQAFIRLQPLIVETAATLRVRVYTERETLQAGALQIAEAKSIPGALVVEDPQ